MRKKLSSRKGFMLSEMIVAVAILALISAALAVGIPTVMKVYQKVTVHAEASLLCDTLATALIDELRFATAANPETAAFDSETYGAGVTIGSNTSGHICIGSREIVSAKAYTGELKAHVTASYDGSLFHVDLEVGEKNGEQPLAVLSFSVHPINS